MGAEVSSSISMLDMSVTDSLISTHHNVFEKHHRFIGWLGLAVCKFHSELETGAESTRPPGASLSQEIRMILKLGNGEPTVIPCSAHRSSGLPCS
jgi:hypothetical protein